MIINIDGRKRMVEPEGIRTPDPHNAIVGNAPNFLENHEVKISFPTSRPVLPVFHSNADGCLSWAANRERQSLNDLWLLPAIVGSLELRSR